MRIRRRRENFEESAQRRVSISGWAVHGGLAAVPSHQCPHCSSRFGKVSNMRTHCKAVHEKVRAHACIYCDGVAFGAIGNHLNRRLGAAKRSAIASCFER
jgi:hypothetical protein